MKHGAITASKNYNPWFQNGLILFFASRQTRLALKPMVDSFTFKDPLFCLNNSKVGGHCGQLRLLANPTENFISTYPVAE